MQIKSARIRPKEQQLLSPASEKIGPAPLLPTLDVVLPVYECQNSLERLCREVHDAVSPHVSRYRLIMVDDGCPGGSWDVISELARSYSSVLGIKLTRNFGQHHAITAGLDAANADYVVVMDADLQDPPSLIPALLQKAQEGSDVVAVKWFKREETLWNRVLSGTYFATLNWLSGSHFDPLVGNYRIISNHVLQCYKLYRERSRSFVAIMNLMGFETVFVEAQRQPRSVGKSSYTFRRRLSLAMDIILAQSDKPLKMSITFGIMVSLLSFLSGIGIVILYFVFDSTLPGWASLMVSFYFLGGLIIANLGLIGRYIACVYDESKARPIYLVHKTTAAQNREDKPLITTSDLQDD